MVTIRPNIVLENQSDKEALLTPSPLETADGTRLPCLGVTPIKAEVDFLTEGVKTAWTQRRCVTNKKTYQQKTTFKEGQVY